MAKAKAYSFLTQALFANYGNRKEQGRLSVLVDTKNNDIYVVPRNKEHIDFVQHNLLQSDKRPSGDELSHYIPSHIDLAHVEGGIEKVVRVITGVSGLETGFNSRHTYEDLQCANKRVWQFIVNGEFPLSENLENIMVTDYLKK